MYVCVCVNGEARYCGLDWIGLNWISSLKDDAIIESNVALWIERYSAYEICGVC